MTWWDWKTGLPFQSLQEKPQPGSLDAEAGVFCSTFDQTGSRLITGGADKTIKVSQHAQSAGQIFLSVADALVPADLFGDELKELCGGYGRHAVVYVVKRLHGDVLYRRASLIFHIMVAVCHTAIHHRWWRRSH